MVDGMDDDSLLIAGIEDKIEQAINKNIITYSGFLDIRQRSAAEAACRKHKELEIFFYGGYSEAERTIAVFLPDYTAVADMTGLFRYFSRNPDENPVAVLSIGKDNFSILNHRDYLGSVMGLGVKREMIGDILVRDDGCDIILLKTIVKFLADNLQKAGRATLSAAIKSVDEIIVPDQKTQETLCPVASLRLDNIVSAAFGLSRSLAAEAVKKGIVSVNGLQTQKPDAKLSQGDKIVLRGKGKAILKELAGETKKGRIKAVFQKFL